MPAAEEEEAGLAYQRCRWCGTPAYRRLLCPTCASPDLAPAHSDGVGIVTRPPQGPQATVFVQLHEGFTVQGRIVGALPGSVHPGTAVHATARTETAPALDPALNSALNSALDPGFDPGFDPAEPLFRLCAEQPGFAAAHRTQRHPNL
ncbi:Zn-ribbon domain-containing OB-fold protein [Streptacidiphilus sp. PAMC 29251]